MSNFSDDVLIQELARIARRFDPVPAVVITHARSSFANTSSWDAALARLIYDSTTDDSDARALVRAGPGARDLTFEGPTLTIEVEIAHAESPGKDHCSILGQLVPGGEASIEVRYPNGSFLVAADSLGRFAIDAAPSGPISLHCTPVGGSSTDTEWTLI